MVISSEVSTPASFFISQVHVVALDFTRNGPRHVLRGTLFCVLVCVCVCVFFFFLYIYFNESMDIYKRNKNLESS